MNVHDKHLTLSWRRSLSYRNQSTDFLGKSIDWFLYNKDPRYERVNWMQADGSLLTHWTLFVWNMLSIFEAEPNLPDAYK